VLVEATRDELAPLDALGHAAGITVLRPAEIGLVMVRGRVGGGGAAFNLGEATVTRAAVTLPTGETGIGHVLGRDKDKARLVAIGDALLQSATTHATVEATILAPIAARIADDQRAARAKAQATKVDFFTMVRGDN
jgi:alpha-D-ribose 1-methylphosphonate 5-triphosphate synthase subunit PhnG